MMPKPRAAGLVQYMVSLISLPRLVSHSFCNRKTDGRYSHFHIDRRVSAWRRTVSGTRNPNFFCSDTAGDQNTVCLQRSCNTLNLLN
ncbi:hypothetical protein BDN72DRAFT_634489 [Pluteus cervinus]|uniref:Uncharacterized protein n=1 Tax=Pluteus cervinus TaxID=181527 RepID=A0ACD3BAE9_9AGAR|nr:hypothetical protein BDN72DRAFT_634489 [Pluteus cervinus]